MVAAARSHLYRVADDDGTRQTTRAWPMGPALLEALGTANSDVGEALQDERTRLNEHGYPDDLPLPALWWAPREPAPDQD